MELGISKDIRELGTLREGRHKTYTNGKRSEIRCKGIENIMGGNTQEINKWKEVLDKMKGNWEQPQDTKNGNRSQRSCKGIGNIMGGNTQDIHK